MVHGLSDSPYSCRALSERFRAEGFTVMVLRLPGHGTCPGALAQVEWTDWAAAVRVAVRDLHGRLPVGVPLLLFGYSNGAALCVDYSAHTLADSSLPRADGLIFLSPMIGITPLAKVTRYHNWVVAVSGEERAHWSSIGAPIDPYKYSSWPMNASVQAWKMTRRIEKDLARLEKEGRSGQLPPVLACQSAVDATVSVSNLIDGLFGRLASPHNELLVFDVNRANWLEDLIRLDFEDAWLPALSREDLPYELTIVTNVAGDSRRVEVISRDGVALREEPLEASWPPEVFSLSHVALPFPPTDPIYGERGADDGALLPLGKLDFRGENGVLLVSDSQILRLRHNPFYSFMEQHIVEWVGQLGSVDD